MNQFCVFWVAGERPVWGTHLVRSQCFWRLLLCWRTVLRRQVSGEFTSTGLFLVPVSEKRGAALSAAPPCLGLLGPQAWFGKMSLTHRELNLFFQQKSVPRMKCAGCKISVHVMCMEQLEKVNELQVSTSSQTSLLPSSRFLSSAQINFRCKPSFREPASRAVREVSGACSRSESVHR